MTLIRLAPQEWPRHYGNLVPGFNCTQLEYDVCCRVRRDVSILENINPLSHNKTRNSNRGTRIDKMIERPGLKPPQYWCACEVGAVFIDCGALVPEGYPDCDKWLPYVQPRPRPGWAVLYGDPGDAHHIEIVVRWEPEDKFMITAGGNRGYVGAPTNDGVGCFEIPVTRRDILGYIEPKNAYASEDERRRAIAPLQATWAA